MVEIKGALSSKDQIVKQVNGDWLGKHYPSRIPDSAVEANEKARLELYKAEQKEQKPQTR